MSNTIALTARELHRILVDLGANVSNDFTASAGQDFGYVAAWDLGEVNGYLIQYGNNGQTDYEFADDADDLAAWLEYDSVEGLDQVIQTANVRGADAVDGADAETEGTFCILVTRSWCDLTYTSEFIANDDRLQTPREFLTYQAAQDFIDATEADGYRLSHNESGAPNYKIV